MPQSTDAALGKVVWVRALGREVFAVAADTGPRFGEGSIALHHLLGHGRLIQQKPGPISADKRCTEPELKLAAPYQSRPDAANDKCRPAYKATRRRGYQSLYGHRLGGVHPTQRAVRKKQQRSEGRADAASITPRADAARYTREKLNAMATCLQSGR